MERTIIHLNIADFAVAVERKIDQRLIKRPVIISNENASRATVYDMSEEAYQAGVYKGMSLLSAKRISKDFFILPPRTDRYERAMNGIFRHLTRYSPLVEMGEDDGHMFVDVTGTHLAFGHPMDIAWQLRKKIKNDLGVFPVWSVAPNKLVAKVATRLVKPDGEFMVNSGEEEALLSPLPVSLIPGIEHGDLTKLYELNLTFVNQITPLNIIQLHIPFGKKAQVIYELVRGIDTSPVLSIGQNKPYVSADHEFANDTNDINVLKKGLYNLIEQTGLKLRNIRLAARRIAIFLDYSDGKREIRQASVKPATANDFTLFEIGRKFFESLWIRRVRIRHMRIVCDRLTFPPAQMELFPKDREIREKREKLMFAMDNIRERFGNEAIYKGFLSVIN